jgi:hypothetical protein
LDQKPWDGAKTGGIHAVELTMHKALYQGTSLQLTEKLTFFSKRLEGSILLNQQCTNSLYQGTTSSRAESALICWALAPAGVIHHENLQGIFTSMISGNQHQN